MIIRFYKYTNYKNDPVLIFLDYHMFWDVDLIPARWSVRYKNSDFTKWLEELKK